MAYRARASLNAVSAFGARRHGAPSHRTTPFDDRRLHRQRDVQRGDHRHRRRAFTVKIVNLFTNRRRHRLVLDILQTSAIDVPNAGLRDVSQPRLRASHEPEREEQRHRDRQPFDARRPQRQLRRRERRRRRARRLPHLHPSSAFLRVDVRQRLRGFIARFARARPRSSSRSPARRAETRRSRFVFPPPPRYSFGEQIPRAVSSRVARAGVAARRGVARVARAARGVAARGVAARGVANAWTHAAQSDADATNRASSRRAARRCAAARRGRCCARCARERRARRATRARRRDATGGERRATARWRRDDADARGVATKASASTWLWASECYVRGPGVEGVDVERARATRERVDAGRAALSVAR